MPPSTAPRPQRTLELRIRRVLRYVLVAAMLVLVALAINVWRRPSKQVSLDEAGTSQNLKFDVDAAAARLASALRIPTVSPASAEDHAALRTFNSLHALLETSFPKVHSRLEREVVNKGSLVLTWRPRTEDASTAALLPILFLAHLDVVPAAVDGWTHPPFSGAIVASTNDQAGESTIWGRGALDCKGPALALLEAIEALIASGYEPKRTLYFAFGHDEETGGATGNRTIAAQFAARETKFECVIDEGGFVTRGLVPVVDAPVALVGIAEKGILNLELRAEHPGGHGAAPPKRTAVGTVAHAIDLAKAAAPKAGINGATRELLEYLAPEATWTRRVALSNLWLFGGAVTRQFLAQPTSAATVQTTAAATLFDGGVRDNVLPPDARAVVQFRLLPGVTTDALEARVRAAVHGLGVAVARVGAMSEASSLSSTKSKSFETLQRVTKRVFPNALFAPYLVIGATDSRHYAEIASDVYRFTPFPLDASTNKSLHGKNECVRKDDYAGAIRFYTELVVEVGRDRVNP